MCLRRFLVLLCLILLLLRLLRRLLWRWRLGTILRLLPHDIALWNLLGGNNLRYATMRHVGHPLVAVSAVVVNVLEPVEKARQTSGADAKDADSDTCHSVREPH